ncbi:hypothetical protein B0A50_05281 [Salinomyces thailandicus]|uniref:Pcc1-domain-containing protein n=1 Tax=Salinomyces thailandicus TaxID=706561 RepID=A0A4U0TX87_9PEZI|nr:hypothetical protein B0A50_05281 [Salinomyces thailandica]
MSTVLARSIPANRQTDDMDADFPCSLTLHIPFPSHRLAQSALRTLSVDEELSPLVRRSFSLVSTEAAAAALPDQSSTANLTAPKQGDHDAKATTLEPAISETTASTTENTNETPRVLRVDYKASTNRMLRVAVNGFFESLGVVIQVMEELDVDVLHEKGIEGLQGAQGVEQGMTGSAGGA